jgi:hypothetical protein
MKQNAISVSGAVAVLVAVGYAALGGVSIVSPSEVTDTLPAPAEDAVPEEIDTENRQALAANAAGCETRSIYVSGGEAHYTECQSGAERSITGWLKDTSADGQCAQVYAYNDGGTLYRSAKACPKGEVREFDWSTPTSDFRVYLRRIG